MGYDLLSLSIGKLGYGNMRLPKRDGKIDYETIFQMIDTFLASGNSYFDTAYLYENSEEVLREALVKRHPRDSFQIATKVSHCCSQSSWSLRWQAAEQAGKRKLLRKRIRSPYP